MRTIFIVSFWHFEEISGFNWYDKRADALDQFKLWKAEAKSDTKARARIRLVVARVPKELTNDEVTDHVLYELDEGDLLPAHRVALVNC